MTKFEASVLKPKYEATISLGTSAAGGPGPVVLDGSITGAASLTGQMTSTPPAGAVLAGTISGGGAATGGLTVDSGPAPADITAFEILGSTSLDPAGSPAYGVDGVFGNMARIRVTALAGAAIDPSKIAITVQDPGFDNAGGTITPVTRTRTLVPKAVLRRPAPNQATKLSLVGGVVAAPTVGQPVDYFLMLPESVYAGSTVTKVEATAGFYGAAGAGLTASITNNSVRAYQHPVLGFMNMPNERVAGSSYPVELHVTHRHAMKGQAVAGVDFIGSDGTHTTSVQSVAPELSALQTREAIAEVFKGAVPTTALDAAGASSICTVDAKVYPWIGTVYQLSVDGATWPTAQPCVPLRFVNDRLGGYGGAIACVKAGATGGTVSTTISGARAAPFPTINAAMTAIATWNNTLSGGHTVAHNDYGGAAIYLMADGGVEVGHELSANYTAAAGTCWIDIFQDPANNARAYYSMVNARRADGGLVRLQVDVEKTGSTGALSCNDAAQGSSKMLAVMNATVNLTAGTTNPWLTSVGLVYQRNVRYPISGGQNVPALSTHSTSGLRCAQAIGITYGDNTTTQVVNVTPYMAIGLSGKLFITSPSASSQSTNDGGIFDNNKFFAISATMNILGSDWPITRGFALTQSVLEFISGQDFGVSASASTVNVNNVMTFGLTIPHSSINVSDDVGRFNHGYNDVTATRGKMADIVVRNVVSGRMATKSDYFSYYNSAGVVGNVGNFSVAYNLDSRGNVMSFNRPVTIDGSEYFRKAADALTAWNVGAIGYADNKATTAGSGGFGTYIPTGAGNPVYSRVLAGDAWRKYDLSGALRKNDGTGAAGAYESIASYTWVTRRDQFPVSWYGSSSTAGNQDGTGVTVTTVMAASVPGSQALNNQGVGGADTSLTTGVRKRMSEATAAQKIGTQIIQYDTNDWILSSNTNIDITKMGEFISSAATFIDNAAFTGKRVAIWVGTEAGYGAVTNGRNRRFQRMLWDQYPGQVINALEYWELAPLDPAFTVPSGGFAGATDYTSKANGQIPVSYQLTDRSHLNQKGYNYFVSAWEKDFVEAVEVGGVPFFAVFPYYTTLSTAQTLGGNVVQLAWVGTLQGCAMAIETLGGAAHPDFGISSSGMLTRVSGTALKSQFNEFVLRVTRNGVTKRYYQKVSIGSLTAVPQRKTLDGHMFGTLESNDYGGTLAAPTFNKATARVWKGLGAGPFYEISIVLDHEPTADGEDYYLFYQATGPNVRKVSSNTMRILFAGTDGASAGSVTAAGATVAVGRQLWFYHAKVDASSYQELIGDIGVTTPRLVQAGPTPTKTDINVNPLAFTAPASAQTYILTNATPGGTNGVTMPTTANVTKGKQGFIWMAAAAIDFSVEANRLLFRSSLASLTDLSVAVSGKIPGDGRSVIVQPGGRGLNVGATVTPFFYDRGGAADFGKNFGTGGDFEVWNRRDPTGANPSQGISQTV